MRQRRVPWSGSGSTAFNAAVNGSGTGFTPHSTAATQHSGRPRLPASRCFERESCLALHLQPRQISSTPVL